MIVLHLMKILYLMYVQTEQFSHVILPNLVARMIHQFIVPNLQISMMNLKKYLNQLLNLFQNQHLTSVKQEKNSIVLMELLDVFPILLYTVKVVITGASLKVERL